MSQSGELDPDIPDRETCQKLTEQFAEVTGTDEACAQFYLQDRKWDLERSVNAFFEATQNGGVSFLTDGDEGELVVNVNKAMVNALGLDQATSEPPSKFSFISWNLDGLDERNLKRRTKAVCKIIYMEKPDIVFLQEVIQETFSYIENKLPEYMCIAGNTDGYFIATLLRRFTVYYDSHKITEHSGSLMMRNLLTVEAHIGSLKLQLVNTHLESTKDHASERIKQLKDSFKVVQDFAEENTVLLSGDMNLRDKELELAGGIPPGIEDLWISCGSRKECQYTWDMVRNCNKEMPGRFKPRCRFDRAYIRHSHPKRVTPVHFGLVGIEKVTSTQCFPSDHWGLHIHFKIETSDT
ncbi:tyrosyl-DNA phosphodiesterase 2-like isoform X2 [Zootermopsis nevadensis]|uniref:Tyrosyl-DNA phosphodiesterase 2 n=2 Tax=Zootermopsis nevadensis TaxID=136037 RepID=A0A067R822_ZOONE|nr:tyrosyl-DNA phosphodiesterase 2-like isoform X2 [Zootermopsis nevadensis]XP_021919596.1 tyrosyl-DNA phosphodiesterase 2-like isoform X2 [Zootermopsis nevadensis]XP_021919597.1 tyrosyl-DNA phosphodiesterase 2-like isoform X2 [Zootermopsis nevadensis]KDR19586.1 TRAF and TNF receptor-associated protein-like protein [Zootermopsis nevadensis]